MAWFVYIIACSDDTLYTGITNDPNRRFGQHAGRRGAKYFYGRRPLDLVYLETGHDRRSAAQREYAIKKLPRPAKLRLIASNANQIAALSPTRPTPSDDEH